MKDRTVKEVQCSWGTCGRGRGNGGDKREGICQWAAYTYMKQNDETSCNCFKWGWKGVGEGRW
jgi:hypothetical protein